MDRSTEREREIFQVSISFKRPLESTQSYTQWVPLGFYAGVKWPGREAEQLNAEVKN
jgi:hypothetical protein